MSGRFFSRYRLIGTALAALLAAALLVPATPASAHGSDPGALSSQQRAALYSIARDSWKFYAADIDPNTHLPLDNLGPGNTRGSYTSAANIGVYLWAVVSAKDLKLISDRQAATLISATLRSVATLKRSHGFLYQWYDTGNGHVIRNPGDIDCASETTPTQDNCYFLSAVDNGWYASGLVVARQAVRSVAPLASSLLN
ncbi:MAG: DUF3131 domain-containing protein, partial [Jatrophihabitantaceae bacterium]